jgi:DUF4097 and DUF4098 domain-containing protein YvlB
MSETGTTPPRSGCALIAGVLLVLLGVLFLWNNLVGDFSMVRFLARVVVWFSTYWPLLLIVWGIFKLYRRITAPELSRLSFGEVLALVAIVVAGLGMRAGRRAFDELSREVSWNEMIGVLGPDVLGPAHEFAESRSFALSAEHLTIDNLRGSLLVSGTDQSDLKVRLTKRVHRFSEREARRVAELATVRYHEGADGARLEVAQDGPGFAEIDLELRMPRTTGLTIRSRRGPVTLSSLSGGVEVGTSDGFIQGEELSGGIRVETSHGPILLERLVGPVEARNRYASIRISAVQGDVVVENRNGNVAVEDVSGGARIENAHGVVRASSVEGPVEIEAHHSEVSVESTRSDVDAVTSYRPLYVRGARGSVRLENKNGPVIVRDVGGDATVKTRHRSIFVSHVSGLVDIEGELSAVTVGEVDGPITIESSNEDVRVTDFGNTLDVRSTHASLFVTTPRLGGAVHLRSTYGSVELALPVSVSLRVEARSLDGELTNDIPGLELTTDEEESGTVWHGEVGRGEQPVTVETSYGDIVLGVIRP